MKNSILIFVLIMCFGLTAHTQSRNNNWSGLLIDLGTSNFLENNQFPDKAGAAFAVRPVGSWYVGLNAVNTSRILGPLYLELGAGVSWHNFKFKDHSVTLVRDGEEVQFISNPEPFAYEMSKLTATHINVSAVPVLYFGRRGRNQCEFLGGSGYGKGLRVGAGVFAGYRIDAYTRQNFRVNGEKNKEINKDDFFINNIRYGVRLQAGIGRMDFFLNYDVSEMFYEGRGPQLNPITLGVTF